MTAKTGEASTVHEPFGSPSGPGLWHHKGMQLPAYIQHVAHHLVSQGHDESRAIEMAVGIVKNWAEGHDGHGNRVHPDVQAAATKNIAQWEADKARAGKARRSAVTVAERADSKKPYGNVTYADPKNGKYPIDTEEHARAAWSYINMPKNAAQYPMGGVTLSEVKDRIRAACKKFGIDVSDGDSSSRSAPYQPEYIRPVVPLDDIRILTRADGSTTGRTVEAFATVFDTPVPISDHEGKYTEVIDPAAFNKTLSDMRRSRRGLASVKVLFNHGKTADGESAPEFTKPIGVPVAIEADPRGLLTRTEYNNTQHAEEVLELIRSGSITSQSFTGRIIRSDPQSRRGYKHRPDPHGSLPLVRRLELGLREYGPVLWAAYDDAEILGVRMATPGSVWEPDPDEALLPDAEAATGEPLARMESDEHSARYHQHALYRLRSQELREKHGLVW